ncbi:MAG: leucine-rich repeat protein, partial [Paludibacteraceae bacterium]|nr:leucine-rich repeat protein [Paludibacteraceae bacterium]
VTEYIIGDDVKGIGDYAFYSCSSLTSITCEAVIPPTIGSYTFGSISKSIPVYVPCGCVEAYKAASGWKDFTNIQGPLAEYQIGVYVNNNIMGTAKMDIHDACGTQISATPNVGYHFVQWNDGNTNNPRTLELTQDTILTAEFAQSFSGQCGNNLYWELIDTTLQIIGSGAMYDYNSNTVPWKLLVSSIKALGIGEKVTSIGNYAFYNCSSLTSVTIPNSVTSIGNSAFSGCSSLTKTNYTGDITSWCDIKFGNGSANPMDYSHNFYINNQEIKDLVIPNSIDTINDYAFYNCGSLTSVTIPNSVTSIGNSAFRGCSSLTSVTIPNRVTSIYDYAFYKCSSLTSVTIGNSVTSIESTAFSGCSSLTSVTINSDAIVNKAYSSSSNISNIFGSQVTEYIIGDDVKGIGNYAFESCSSLTSVTIPNSVTSIGEYAFSFCPYLTSVNIPKSVTSIESGVFYNCSGLTSVTIGESVTSIGCVAFYDCSSLTSVTIGNSVTSIEEEAFSGCSGLTSVNIPNSLKTIGTSAFEGCVRLGKISLGTGVEEIAANAFAECTRLYDVYCYATYPPLVDDSAFANYNVYLYVPCESQRDYTLDIVWGKFKFIECIDSEDVTTDGVVVTPSTNDVTITWPTESNADTYTIVIKKGNEVFCTLTFNADGQLLNIAFAPGRDGNHPVQYAEQAVNGYRFTVTGLEEGTHYAYNIDVKDAADKTIKSYTGEFTTESLTAVEEIEVNDNANVQKILRNSQLIILHNGKTYNAMGQEL